MDDDNVNDNEPEELSEDGERGDVLDSLSDAIVRRYDPDRILQSVSKKAGKGERLDLATRSRYEKRLGVDLSRVRVYTGEFARQVTDAHKAEAITVGTTGMIMMGGLADRSPATSSGRALLAHELTHVAQSERRVHRSARFGELPELTKEQSEEEAEHVEAEELSGGQSDFRPEHEMTESEFLERRTEAIRQRVFELLEEDGRVDELRRGARRFRP